jgi:hypothetical protein
MIDMVCDQTWESLDVLSKTKSIGAVESMEVQTKYVCKFVSFLRFTDYHNKLADVIFDT